MLSKYKFQLQIIIPIVLLSLISSIFYIKYSPLLFNASSKILIKRSMLESPDLQLPDIRNRWVWMRDGLDIKNVLLSDQFIFEVLKQSKLNFSLNLNQDLNLFTQQQIKRFKLIKSSFDIQYSGPDDNIFTIRIEASSSSRAIIINDVFVNKFNQYFLIRKKSAYISIISQINNSLKVLINPDARQALKESLTKFKISYIASTASNNNSFHILENANSNSIKIWPKSMFIIISALVIGVALGLVLYLTITFLRKE